MKTVWVTKRLGLKKYQGRGLADPAPIKTPAGRAQHSQKHLQADASTHKNTCWVGSPPATSAIGRKKQGSQSKQAGQTNQIRKLHMHLCTSIQNRQQDGGKHLLSAANLQMHVHTGTCKYVHSHTKREPNVASGFMPAISALSQEVEAGGSKI